MRYHDDQRGYIRCTVTPKQWHSEIISIPDVTHQNGKAVRRASFHVTAGKPGAVHD